MTSSAPAAAFSRESTEATGKRVYRHGVVARTAHWAWTLAMLVLVMSGLQIFNAAPYLDASDKSNPARRVLAFDAKTVDGRPVGYTIVFGHAIPTTHLFGYTDDGMGAKAPRAFPGWLTLPGQQDLADGRRWHLFFAWALFVAWAAYLISAADPRQAARARDAAGRLSQALADAALLPARCAKSRRRTARTTRCRSSRTTSCCSGSFR